MIGSQDSSRGRGWHPRHRIRIRAGLWNWGDRGWLYGWSGSILRRFRRVEGRWLRGKPGREAWRENESSKKVLEWTATRFLRERLLAARSLRGEYIPDAMRKERIHWAGRSAMRAGRTSRCLGEYRLAINLCVR